MYSNLLILRSGMYYDFTNKITQITLTEAETVEILSFNEIKIEFERMKMT